MSFSLVLSFTPPRQPLFHFHFPYPLIFLYVYFIHLIYDLTFALSFFSLPIHLHPTSIHIRLCLIPLCMMDAAFRKKKLYELNISPSSTPAPYSLLLLTHSGAPPNPHARHLFAPFQTFHSFVFRLFSLSTYLLHTSFICTTLPNTTTMYEFYA